MNKLITLIIVLSVNFNFVLSQDNEYYRNQLLEKPVFDTVILVHLNLNKALQNPEKYKVIEIYRDFYNYDSLKYLTKFGNVHTIEFVQTTMQNLPEEFTKFRNIRKLRFYNNGILDIEQALEVFSDNNIVELSITNSNISDIPFNVHKFKGLKVLDLEDNQIEKIGDSLILYNTNIEVLNLKSNKIRIISSQLPQMKNLREIDLSENPINDKMNFSTLNSMFSNTHIEILGLNYCGFIDFPIFIQNMCCLKLLKFYGNKIYYVPQTLNLNKFSPCSIWIDLQYANLFPDKIKHIFCIQ